MVKAGITAHMVVKNEDIFIWYAISSIIDFASQIIIYDTGSKDHTVDIIKSFKSKKISFEEKGPVNSRELTTLRQEQIDKTKTDWIWVVDGDEIYPEITIKEIMHYLKENKFEGGVVRRFDLLGDIYHYQSEDVGEYNLFGQKGHLVLRLINKKKIPSLQMKGSYPYEGYYDKEGTPLINHPKENFFITQNRLFHAMYLKRSTLGSSLENTLHRNKYKIEKGYPFSATEQFPDVFFRPKPNLVTDVILPRNNQYELIASFLTPIKKAKRKLWKLFL